MHADRLGDDVAHPLARVERRDRVLEDHLQREQPRTFASRIAEAGAARPAKWISPALGRSSPTAMRPSVDFPLPEFTHQAEHLAVLHRERDVRQRLHPVAARASPNALRGRRG